MFIHHGAPQGMTTVVICHAGVSLLPLDQPEDSDKDKGVRDGMADGGACAGGH
jgi:hypothetical protein